MRKKQLKPRIEICHCCYHPATLNSKKPVIDWDTFYVGEGELPNNGIGCIELIRHKDKYYKVDLLKALLRAYDRQKEKIKK